jgi:hypothetical protein
MERGKGQEEKRAPWEARQEASDAGFSRSLFEGGKGSGEVGKKLKLKANNGKGMK